MLFRSLAGARANNTYFEFKLTPSSGYALSIDSITSPLDRSYSQNRSRTMYVTSSVTGDNYATSLGSSSFDNSGWGPINLGLAVQDQTSEVTMRLYVVGVGAWEGVGFKGTPGNALEVNGSVALVPEPGTLAALLALGSSVVLRRQRRPLAKE